MQEIILAGVSAAAGSGLSGFVIKMMAKSYFEGLKHERDVLKNQVNELAKIIENLKNEHIKKLEIKIENHIDDDKSQEILTKLDSISSQLEKKDNTIQFHDREISTLRANDKARHEYIQNIDQSLQRHKQEKHS